MTNVYDGLAVTEIICAANASVESGQPVELHARPLRKGNEP